MADFSQKVVFALGATGNTGYSFVEQLLKRGHLVKTIVHSHEKIPQALLENRDLTLDGGVN